MLARRSLTLLGSIVVFCAVSISLFVFPGFEPAIFSLYALIFIWNDFRGEEEAQVIYAVLSLAAGVMAAARLSNPAATIALGAETAGVALLGFAMTAHRGRFARARGEALSAVDRIDAQIRDGERELRFYNNYESSAVAQIRLRRDLTSAAKSLGNTMDAEEVQKRLLRIVLGRYAGTRAEILPGAPRDPLVSWSMRTHSPEPG